MLHVHPLGTALYRATRDTDTWADVLQGFGAYFGTGGRYHYIRQQTVYSSIDPLVALNEWGWHVGLGYWSEMGDRTTLAYPLARMGKLWQFSFDTDISLIDVANLAAPQHFGYPSHAPFNPHADRYTATQHLATSVSAYHNPNLPHVHYEGILAPSVRTIPRIGYSPTQIVLFPKPALQGLPVPLGQRAALLTQWDVELEFCTPDTDQSVTANDPLISWARPWVRLSGPIPVPKFIGRPGSVALAINDWFTLDVRHTQY